MRCIVAVDKNFGIGKEDKLQVSIRKDQLRFKELTLGKVIILGRKTLDTFPQRKALPGRKNIVLSRDKTLRLEEITICHSLEELLQDLESLKNQEGYTEADFIVVGGDSVYRMLLPYCDEVLLTLIDAELPADRFFPNLDQDSEWQQKDQSSWEEENGLRFCYIHYERIKSGK